MSKISLHRALSELKIIEDRINSKIEDFHLIDITKGEDGLIEGKTQKVFNDNARSINQSIDSLIDRKILLKTEINKANANTMLSIGGKSMSILEAIAYKDIIRLKQNKLKYISRQNSKALTNLDNYNEKVDNQALHLAENTVGKDKTPENIETIDSIMKAYKKANTYSLIDPLGIQDLISDLSDEIYNFNINIDAALSEVNAITLIEV